MFGIKNIREIILEIVMFVSRKLVVVYMEWCFFIMIINKVFFKILVIIIKM